MKTIVECQHCNYIWTTRSTFLFITCPSCKYKTPNKPIKLIPVTQRTQAIKKALTKITAIQKDHDVSSMDLT